MNDPENMDNLKDEDLDESDSMSMKKDEATDVIDKEKLITHLKEHITYPATSDELIEACNQMSDVSPDDKKWFAENLPEDTYESADDVMNTVGLKPSEA